MKQTIALATAALIACAPLAQAEPEVYEPTWESLEQHPMPDWFRDAKLGIFIHWGVYSVPAFAPKGKYAEWYPLRMYTDKAHRQFHEENYGSPEEFPYTKFVDMFKAEKWDPEAWADLFVEAGAKYVVPVAEHHDGIAMWDSALTEWDVMDKGPKRDIIGELEKAVRARGLKFAPSYHRMMCYFDPAYGDVPYAHPHFDENGKARPEFVPEWRARWEELQDKYRPDILWWDGDWKVPDEVWGSKEILANYYNKAREWGKEVVANDRLGKTRGKRGDFYTQEYQHGIKSEGIIPKVWESCRGIGKSFGYNRIETDEDSQTTAKLLHQFVDIVSKNGNLLLNIGPRADGTIPEIQRDRLLGIGKWLKANGEAIYGTRPWQTFGEGDTIRFTHKGNTVYVILLNWPDAPVKIQSMAEGSAELPGKIETVALLGASDELKWSRDSDGLTVTLPEEKPGEHAYVIAVSISE